MVECSELVADRQSIDGCARGRVEELQRCCWLAAAHMSKLDLGMSRASPEPSAAEVVRALELLAGSKAPEHHHPKPDHRHRPLTAPPNTHRPHLPSHHHFHPPCPPRLPYPYATALADGPDSARSCHQTATRRRRSLHITHHGSLIENACCRPRHGWRRRCASAGKSCFCEIVHYHHGPCERPIANHACPVWNRILKEPRAATFGLAEMARGGWLKTLARNITQRLPRA